MTRIFNCLICGEFSFSLFCTKCKKLIKPDIKYNDDVISFYNYENIEYLIKFKYKKFGNIVFKELSKPFGVFSKNYSGKLNIVPIDDKTYKGYSHTAVLASSMKKDNKLYSVLYSKNSVRYAGKSLEFRLQNPREFIYKGPENLDVVLVDDVVTTKTTLNEAKEVLKKHNVNVLFCLVLADLRK